MKDTFVQDGLSVKITSSVNPVNPRSNDDCNETVMALSHRRYNLGDRFHSYKAGSYHGWEGMRKDIEDREAPTCIKPLYMMDHSGLSISTEPFGCGFDSGQVGWVFVPASKGLTAEQASHAILREVEEYGAYLSGELYDVSIENMLSAEPLMEEYSMTRDAAEQAVTEFFSNRGAQ